SHDPSHALHISDCCLMLKKGLTHIFGPSEEVITESCLGEAFGIEARIYTHINDDGEASKGVLPILKPYRRE
ncbi:MAG: hypothetical protein PQJ50_13240, partial [Spirochaetales bacterium]|nr:hypothetical protein [Spirochaetales bacterium]